MEKYIFIALLIVLSPNVNSTNYFNPPKASNVGNKNNVVTPPNKDGWWIRVNTAKTEASQIVFEIGTDDNNRKFWRNWNSADPSEFDVPDEYKNVAELYIHASSNPGNKNSWFCMMYKANGVKHFDFDDDEDHKEKQTNVDDECK
ncbi:MAG TPA: hypothetical protein VGE79_05445 [Niastella sp.]